MPSRLDTDSGYVTLDTIALRRGEQNPLSRSIYSRCGTVSISRITDISLGVSLQAAGVGGSTLQIYNFTRQPISIIDSSNAVVIIEPIRDSCNESSIYQDQVIVDITHGSDYDSATPEMGEYLRQRELAFRSQPKDCILSNEVNNYPKVGLTKFLHRFTFDRFDELLASYDGAMYFQEANIIFQSLTKPNDIAIHPQSPTTLKDAAGFREDKLKPSFKFSLGLNDNAHNFEKAFVNLSGEVVELEISRDPVLEDGVRVYQQGRATRKPIVEFYPLEQLGQSPYTIYRTRQDALEGGDRLKQKEYEAVEQKIRMMEIKHQQAEEELVRRQESLKQQEILQQQKHQREQEQFDRKVKEEEYQRKVKEEELRIQRENEERARIFRIQEEDRLRKLKNEEEDRMRDQKERDRIRNEKVENVSFWRKFISEGVRTVAAVATAVAVTMGWYLKRKA